MLFKNAKMWVLSILICCSAVTMGKTPDREMKHTMKTFTNSAPILYLFEQNRYLDLGHNPYITSEGNDLIYLNIATPVRTFVWELTGFFKADWTGEHIFSIAGTEAAKIQLGWKRPRSTSFYKLLVDEVYLFAKTPKGFDLQQGQNYPIKITFVAGIDPLPVFVSFNGTKEDANGRVQQLTTHETKLKGPFEDARFAYAIVVAPPGQDHEILLREYMDAELLLSGFLDASFSGISLPSVVFPRVLEITGHVSPPESGVYRAEISDSLKLALQIGPGVRRKQERYHVDKRWKLLDSRELTVVDFHLDRRLIYPFRIVVFADLEWDLKITDPTRKETDLFQLWGSGTAEKPSDESPKVTFALNPAGSEPEKSIEMLEDISKTPPNIPVLFPLISFAGYENSTSPVLHSNPDILASIHDFNDEWDAEVEESAPLRGDMSPEVFDPISFNLELDGMVESDVNPEEYYAEKHIEGTKARDKGVIQNDIDSKAFAAQAAIDTANSTSTGRGNLLMTPSTVTRAMALKNGSFSHRRTRLLVNTDLKEKNDTQSVSFSFWNTSQSIGDHETTQKTILESQHMNSSFSSIQPSKPRAFGKLKEVQRVPHSLDSPRSNLTGSLFTDANNTHVPPNAKAQRAQSEWSVLHFCLESSEFGLDKDALPCRSLNLRNGKDDKVTRKQGKPANLSDIGSMKDTEVDIIPETYFTMPTEVPKSAKESTSLAGPDIEIQKSMCETCSQEQSKKFRESSNIALSKPDAAILEYNISPAVKTKSVTMSMLIAAFLAILLSLF